MACPDTTPGVRSTPARRTRVTCAGELAPRQARHHIGGEQGLGIAGDRDGGDRRTEHRCDRHDGLDDRQRRSAGQRLLDEDHGRRPRDRQRVRCLEEDRPELGQRLQIERQRAQPHGLRGVGEVAPDQSRVHRRCGPGRGDHVVEQVGAEQRPGRERAHGAAQEPLGLELGLVAVEADEVRRGRARPGGAGPPNRRHDGWAGRRCGGGHREAPGRGRGSRSERWRPWPRRAAAS